LRGEKEIRGLSRKGLETLKVQKKRREKKLKRKKRNHHNNIFFTV
jgi:hypothetical protein